MTKYHLKRKERKIKENNKIKEILKQGKYITISMCRKDEPYVVTLNYGYDESKNSLYFHCAKEGLKLEFLRENKRVCGTIIQDKGYLEGKCDYAYSSVVLWGNMNFIEDLQEKEYGIRVMIYHLEKKPEKVIEKLLNKPEAIKRFKMLRLDIIEIVGKSSSKV